MEDNIKAKLEEILKKKSSTLIPIMDELAPEKVEIKNNSKEWLKVLMHSRDQMHLWHLQTRSYSEHKALNKYYDSIIDMLDNLLETLIADGQRPEGGFTIELANYSEGCSQEHLTGLIKSVQTLKLEVDANRTDILNIIDEIIALSNKTRYLLTLK
jgi:DNA-binding ferritin-like protein